MAIMGGIETQAEYDLEKKILAMNRRHRMRAISVWKDFDFEEVEFNGGNVLHIRGNISEATIRANGKDEEIDVVDYVLEDMEFYSEQAHTKDCNGFIPFAETAYDRVKETIKGNKFLNDKIEQKIRDKYWDEEA